VTLVKKECHAALDDPQGFKNTLLKHDLEFAGFRNKEISGFYVLPALLSRSLKGPPRRS
jgi:hypothetical protein